MLGTAAVLEEWKRIDRLIRAVAPCKLPGLHLVVVGDGEERERLESLRRTLGIRASVHFVGRQERPWDFFQVMDVFSLPSMELESFGNAAVEAMALGLPTIVFADGGGLLEHVEHGRTGIVVETQPELEQAISQLMRERPRCARDRRPSARLPCVERYSTAAGSRCLRRAVRGGDPEAASREAT